MAKAKLTPVPKYRPGRIGKAPCQPAGATPPPEPDLTRIAADLRDRVMPCAELAFMVGNPMLHPEGQVEELRASLRQFGQVLPLIVNTAKTPPEIVGGNGGSQKLAGWEKEIVPLLTAQHPRADGGYFQTHVWRPDP